MPTSSRGPLDTTAEVETPEHIRFGYRLAGPARRGIAYIFDLLVKGVVAIVLFVAMAMVGFERGQVEGWSLGVYAIIVFVLEWGYYVFFETIWSGRSPGKRLFRLRVVKEGGYPINFVDSVLRNLLRAADFLPSVYALGVVVMGFDTRFRRLGDFVAGTMVVVEERSHLGEPARIQPAPTAEELAAFPPAVRLSANELEALDLFVRRSKALGPSRSAELAEMVAPALAARAPNASHDDGPRFLSLLYHRATESRSPQRP